MGGCTLPSSPRSQTMTVTTYSSWEPSVLSLSKKTESEGLRKLSTGRKGRTGGEAQEPGEWVTGWGFLVGFILFY